MICSTCNKIYLIWGSAVQLPSRLKLEFVSVGFLDVVRMEGVTWKNLEICYWKVITCEALNSIVMKGIAVVSKKMALEGDQVGLEKLFVDTSDTDVTFPSCPDVAREFFQPQRTSTRKPPDKGISDKIQYHIDRQVGAGGDIVWATVTTWHNLTYC